MGDQMWVKRQPKPMVKQQPKPTVPLALGFGSTRISIAICAVTIAVCARRLRRHGARLARNGCAESRGKQPRLESARSS